MIGASLEFITEIVRSAFGNYLQERTIDLIACCADEPPTDCAQAHVSYFSLIRSQSVFHLAQTLNTATFTNSKTKHAAIGLSRSQTSFSFSSVFTSGTRKAPATNSRHHTSGLVDSHSQEFLSHATSWRCGTSAQTRNVGSQTLE